jgi:sigma-B regulation protein RsbU (phosphoserine phosphatase)
MPGGALESKSKPPGPARVALMVSYLSDEYEWQIWRGARAAVEARGGTLLCAAGGTLNDPVRERRARNFVLDLVGAGKVDGLIAISSVVGQYLGPDAAGEFLRRHAIPACSIGAATGVPSVTVDQADGVVQLIDHLVTQHAHRRVAFVTGSRGNPEAELRLTAYVRALQRLGLPYDPKLVIEGDFTRESGVQAACTLLDRRQIRVSELDAIVAANDYTAFGVMDELARRRIAVPEQVAVVGFDDMALASDYSPPLTTVRQPIEALGREAARLVCDRIARRADNGGLALHTEVVLRRSCGCVPTDMPPLSQSLAEGPTPLVVDELGTQLLAAVLDEARGARGAFERALGPFIDRALGGRPERRVPSDLLFAGEGGQPNPDVTARARIERTLERSRLMVEEMTLVSRPRAEEISDRLHRLGRALMLKMFGPQAHLSTVLVEHLPELGIDECAVSELGRGERRALLKLAFGFHPGDLQPKLAEFPAHDFAPREFEGLHSRSSIVLPLSYGGESLGVAMLPVSHHDGDFYETLAEIFGIVLKGMQQRGPKPA